MRLNISQNELQNALAVVSKGISTRSTLPILSGIYLEAKNDVLTLQATDLELSIQYSVDSLIEEEGDTVVPGKLFSEIVKSLPDAAISLEMVGDNLIVICDTASFSLKTLNPLDFPGFPVVKANQTIKIPFTQFSSMVRKVARVVSKDESRAILTGVLITMDGQRLKMVATDSYRLAIVDADVQTPQNDSFEAVISGSFLNDIATLGKSDDLVSLALSENQIVISYQNTVFINRRIEGNFPNYQQLLPDSYVTKAEFDVSHLIAAVKRTSLVNATASPIRFDINIDSQTVQLSSVAQDIGSAQETLSCEISGEDAEIAFNFAYILDGLTAVSTDTVYLEVVNSMKPGIFKSASGDSFLYLVMPVRIS